jgi:hypothetical protein
MAASSRVVVVRPAASDPLLAEATTRLSAELTAAGFSVTLLDEKPGTDPRQRVESANLDPPPVATLAILHLGEGAAAEVWVADRLTGKTLVRRIDVGSVSRERMPSVLAVRAVELLRASLLEATVPEAAAVPNEPPEHTSVPDDVARWMTPKPAPAKPPETKAAPPPPKEATKPTPPKPAEEPEPQVEPEPEPEASEPKGPPSPVKFFGEVGGAVVFGLRNAGAAGSPLLRVGAGGESFSGRVSVVAPAFGADIARAEGSASIRQELAVAEGAVTFPRKGTLAAVVSLGGGAYHWHVAGSAHAPNVSQHGDAWGGVVDVGVGGVARFGSHFGVLLDAHGAGFLPKPSVQIASADAGGASFPVGLATLGIWGSL